MSVFEDVHLHWKGRKHTIPASRVMRLIQAVEDIVTLPELDECMRRMKAAKVTGAYAVMLRFAGVPVTDEEVYAQLFEDESKMEEILTEAVAVLYKIILPPASLNQDAKKKPLTRKKKKARRKAS